MISFALASVIEPSLVPFGIEAADHATLAILRHPDDVLAVNLQNGPNIGDPKQIANPGAQVDQDERASGRLRRHIKPYDGSKTHAVHAGELGQIEDDLPGVRNQALHLVTQNSSQAGGQSPGAVDDSGVAFDVGAKAQRRK